MERKQYFFRIIVKTWKEEGRQNTRSEKHKFPPPSSSWDLFMDWRKEHTTKILLVYVSFYYVRLPVLSYTVGK